MSSADTTPTARRTRPGPELPRHVRRQVRAVCVCAMTGVAGIDFTVDDLVRVRGMVMDAAHEAGLDGASGDLVLAVNELATNAIRYAGGRGRLTIAHTPAGLDVIVSDKGPGLPPDVSTDLPAPSMANGRGMWLIRRLVADVNISSGPHGTTVRLHVSRSS